jgi:hypothetical protein
MTPNQLLLNIPCVNFVVLRLAIVDHYYPVVTQYSLFQVCCTSTCHQRAVTQYSLFEVCCPVIIHSISCLNLPSTITLTCSCLVFPVLNVLHFNLRSTIINSADDCYGNVMLNWLCFTVYDDRMYFVVA